MICYCGRGLFTLHVESAAWETNPDETTLKKNSFNVAEGGGGEGKKIWRDIVSKLQMFRSIVDERAWN